MALLEVAPQVVPLKADPQGVVRVGGTRVTLASVVAAFRGGATPEQIAQQYPSLALVDIYTVIAFYLRHEGAVEAYLGEYSDVGAEARRANERRFGPSRVRERLSARRAD